MLRFARRFRRPLFFIPAGLLILITAGLAADWWYGIPDDAAAEYVGGQSCIQCHQPQHDLWRGSHHDLAMQVATPGTVRGDFSGVDFEYRGTVSRLFREGDDFLVTTDNSQGEMETFKVKYAFGLTPLQQYMVEFDDGRVQVLPFCWDVKNERWFHIYEEDSHTLSPEDPTHWTGPGQNWNHTCADCHSTNLVKGYHADTNTFETTFTDINVNCEACHGPGSLHVDMAESWSPFWDRKRGYGLPRLKSTDSTIQLETCAKCHAHRDSVHPGFHGGRDFDDHYRLSLIDTGLYYHDGQILEEDYVYGSFLQSRMHRESVRCTDCHDPHTASLKFTGNQLCVQCHVPAKYDTSSHHNHQPDSLGAQCVECHMPERTYMVVDPRRDHSIRMPRPDLSLLIGTPNSCTDCHLEMAFGINGAQNAADVNASGPRTIEGDTIEGDLPELKDYAAWLAAATDGDAEAEAEIAAWNRWAAEKTAAWYGERDPRDHFAITIDSAMRGQLPDALRPTDGDPLTFRRDEINLITQMLIKLADNRDVGPIVRASAVSLLGNYVSQPVVAANSKALKDSSPLVRRAATANLEFIYPIDRIAVWNRDQLPANQRTQLDGQLLQLANAIDEGLSDATRTVRVEAARVASVIPPAMLQPNVKQRLASALAELETGLMANADQAAVWTTWGGVLERQGKLAEAENAYRRAMTQMNAFIPARMALATLYNYQARNEEAETLLREAVAILPELPEAQYSLGLLLAEDPDRLAEAQRHLGLAATHAPRQARIRYNNGLALQQLAQWDDAERELSAAVEISPDAMDYRIALMLLFESRSRWADALTQCEALLRLAPGDPQITAKAEQLRRLAGSR